MRALSAFKMITILSHTLSLYSIDNLSKWCINITEIHRITISFSYSSYEAHIASMMGPFRQMRFKSFVMFWKQMCETSSAISCLFRDCDDSISCHVLFHSMTKKQYNKSQITGNRVWQILAFELHAYIGESYLDWKSSHLILLPHLRIPIPESLPTLNWIIWFSTTWSLFSRGRSSLWGFNPANRINFLTSFLALLCKSSYRTCIDVAGLQFLQDPLLKLIMICLQMHNFSCDFFPAELFLTRFKTTAP